MMTEFTALGRVIVAAGVALVVLGLLVMFADKLPFIGRLPGDLYFRKGNFSIYFPVVTCILLSILLTVLLNIFFRK